ncbi:MAG: class I SAM-dependent methyltransferase [Bdellovibrionales bacterium]
MNYSPAEADLALKRIAELMKNDDPPALCAKKICWTLMSVRGQALGNGLRLLVGDKVYAGPFKDMVLTNDAFFAYGSPVLLGCYEHELHPVFEKVFTDDYTHVLNIGCSVGYYAVGLARRMPHVTVEAFDIDPEARRKCLDMARANNVEDRVRVSGEFLGKDFANYGDKKTLVLMDIECAEKELLDPEKFPALRKMDVIVEMHDLLDGTISKILTDRFAPSHTINVVRNRPIMPDVGGLLPEDYYLDPYDNFLMGWEWRDGKTPWGVFRAKTP